MANSATRRFAINALSNWGLNVVQAVVGIIIGRIGVAHLGAESFGLFNVLYSVLGFLMLFDIGLSASMFRFAAQDQAAGDFQRLREVASTSFALFLALGLLGAGLMLIGEPFMAHQFHVRPELRDGFVAMNVCLAITYLVRFMTLTDAGLLIGANRFDLMNGVDMLSNVLRLALLVIFWLFPPSMMLFGLTFLAQQALRAAGLRLLVRFYVLRTPLLAPQWVTRAALRRMGGFGGVNALNLVGWLLMTEGPTLVLGRLIGPQAAAAFYAPKLVAMLLRTLVVGFANPLIPLAGRDAVQNDGRNLANWSLRLSRLAGIFALSLALPICLFARPMLTIWLGPEQAWIAPLLVATVIGQTFAGIQAANFYLILGAGRMLAVAVGEIISATVSIALACSGQIFLGWGPLGIVGAFAAVSVVRYGGHLAFIASRQFNVPLGLLFIHAYGIPLLPALLVGPAMYGMLWLYPPQEPIMLFVQAGACTLLYLLLAWPLALFQPDRDLIFGLLRRRSSQAPAGA